MSKTGVTVRAAMPEDAAALTACIEAAYQGYRERGIDLPPVAEGIAEDIRNNHVWVACAGDLITGGLILSITGMQAYLVNVAVHPNHSGLGIGRALMDTALSAARAAKCDTIRLTTHTDMPGNVALYQHLGWHITHQNDHRITMQRAL